MHTVYEPGTICQNFFPVAFSSRVCRTIWLYSFTPEFLTLWPAEECLTGSRPMKFSTFDKLNPFRKT